MPRAPSDDEARIARMRVLCVDVSRIVLTSKQHRQTALRLAREALKLAEPARTPRRKAKRRMKGLSNG